MKLDEADILYVLLEYLPVRNRQEERIWKALSSQRGKLSSWHNLTVYCLMEDDGYLVPDGDTYVTTDEGRRQIMPLWRGQQLAPYRPEPIACKLLKAIERILRAIIRLQ